MRTLFLVCLFILLISGITFAAIPSANAQQAGLCSEIALEPTPTNTPSKGIGALIEQAAATDMPASIAEPSLVPALDGVVLEITESGSRTAAHLEPSAQSRVLDTLFWGDRVLWKGESILVGRTNWLEVCLGTNELAYIIENRGGSWEVDPATTTPNIAIGAAIIITPSGGGMNLRAGTSTQSTLVQRLSTGDRLTVIAGPEYAEYYVWWNLQLPDGRTGWAVDVPGWWRVP